MLVAMTMESRYPFGKDWADTARRAGVDVVVIEVVPEAHGPRVANGVTGGGDAYQIERPDIRPDRWFRGLSDAIVGRRISTVLRNVELDRRVDVLHTHFYREMGPVLRMRRRPPHVHTEHSAAFAAIDLGPTAHHRPSAQGVRVARRGCESADAVTAVAVYLAEQMRRFGIAQPIRYIPCPIDPSITTHQVVEPGTPPRLVSVGRLSAEKRVDLLLDAFAEVRRVRPDLVLEIIGAGPLDSSLRQHARRLGLDDAVIWRGAISRAEIAATVAPSALFVTATLSEMFGTAVAEALCLGVPVVGPAVGGLPELLNADFDQGELVDDANPQRLADAIVATLQRTQDRPRIAADARRRFSQERVGSDLVEVYDQVTNGYEHGRT